MKKSLLIALTTSILLIGCKSDEKLIDAHSQEIIGTLTDVKVIDKQIKEIDKRVKKEYIVIVDKNGEEIELKAFSNYSFKAMHINDVVDIGYTEGSYIKEITLIKKGESDNE